MLLSDLNKATKKAETPEVQQKLKQARAVLIGQGPGGDLTKLQKQKVPFLLKYLLGDCVNVVMLQVSSGPPCWLECRCRAIWTCSE